MVDSFTALLPIVENFNKKRTEIIELYGEKDSEGNIAQDESCMYAWGLGGSFRLNAC